MNSRFSAALTAFGIEVGSLFLDQTVGIVPPSMMLGFVQQAENYPP
jgi:hypothetical protein